LIPPDVLRAHLLRQRWYAGQAAPGELTVVHQDVIRPDWPRMVRLIVEADGVAYQLVVGLRPEWEQPEFLRGHERAVLGVIDCEHGPATAYDATYDPELALTLLDAVSGGTEWAAWSRPIGAEQSNTSLVYDERLILKLFRRLERGPNPEVEVTTALSRVGFPWIAPVLGTESAAGFDLALLQPFLPGAVEGWALALTSLRDLFGVYDTQSIPVLDPNAPPPAAASADPSEAGGDFAAEAHRLGETTAGMHAAMAEAFGSGPGDGRAWADDIERQIRPVFGAGRLPDVLDRLRRVDPGIATRTHGDYHLGQVMRTDAGWYILDFEGEPARPLEERRRPTSPLRDVAGMLRSLHYASAVALLDHSGDGDGAAKAWEDRNRQAFLGGYLPDAQRAGILPADHESTETVLAAFELEKAVYELSYERSYRPEWEHIPRAALRRLERM
jgi:maltokinase